MATSRSAARLSLRFTSEDAQLLAHDPRRREIIDGEMYVSTAPSHEHQLVCGEVHFALHDWDLRTGLGQAIVGAGVIFAPDDDVIPDVIWLSNGRSEGAWDDAGHLRVAVELIVEVISPGAANESRDRVAKLKLYARRRVQEYWIVDWRQRLVDIYRREDEDLVHTRRMREPEALESPLLAGFSVPLAQIFRGLPAARLDFESAED